MRTESGTTVHRQDYKPFPFDIPEVELEFDLSPSPLPAALLCCGIGCVRR